MKLIIWLEVNFPCGIVMESSFKKSGVLLHPTALPSKYGIGDLGPEAFKFVDSLAEMRQSYWQGLPIGPTDSSNSPYSLLSTFAGNTLLISIDLLIQEKLLLNNEIPNDIFPDSRVDFEKVKHFKYEVFKVLCDNFDSRSDRNTKIKFKKFYDKNKYWLDDFSEFCAYKDYFGLAKSWNSWPLSKSISESKKRNVVILQFLFHRQWESLKKYCKIKKIKIIGDMPIYVGYESADVWKNKYLFHLNKDNSLKYIAGCPPCEYSKCGQLWGNPIYNWDEHQRENYDWWIKRFKKLFQMVDVVRLDHFIGFKKYWRISGEEKTAINGKWIKGPGKYFFKSIINKVENMHIIAEDLGPTDKEVIKLRDNFNFPGMHVIQFDFENKLQDFNYPHNSILYSGTHDNNTLLGWIKENKINPKIKLKHFENLSKITSWDIIKFILSQDSMITIFPIQDLLELDSNSRFNTPGTFNDKNWTWRLNKNQLSKSTINKMNILTGLLDRHQINKKVLTKFKEVV